ncbi:carbon-nitrogen hydrolase family protein [Beijerinckia indica]|uniref:Nitrilase/cyanide hydratase and apolipoprotein N-acyltransferase n=1 Tax=Beijerinckia indica subsp. indica (strain ATCC 9039 / DSM 1715 / NCIMB 8712) TaxID=395963 RepID=B2IEL0_BEII9|nr:carbon-nitrogen hydrolase family protein [Beijerinckia indica]ACB97018.1 Nitrilase/cyanide hydratase and apolipoprotein N-acyltransferase [Beijerinckia indica subsp. indica ATCC 9039]
MKLSLIQMNTIGDKAANLKTAAELIESAVALERPDWVALPEVFDFIGGTRADKLAAAETLPDGSAYKTMQDLARRHGIFIHAGSILEKIPGEDRLHNTTVVFDRTGQEIARYRKIHMFDITAPDGTAYRESNSFKPGDAIATYPCEDMIVGCSICYDIRFPDLYQALVAKGATMIVVPAAFTMQTGKDHWEVLLRARAIETQAYVCAPAQTGPHSIGKETRQSYGHSLIVDPWGHVIAKASDGVGFVSARIDPALAAKVRAQIPVASHKVAIA